MAHGGRNSTLARLDGLGELRVERLRHVEGRACIDFIDGDTWVVALPFAQGAFTHEDLQHRKIKAHGAPEGIVERLEALFVGFVELQKRLFKQRRV
jgi:hypothetical protein